MKKSILTLLASATLANAGLTGTQIQQVIKWEDQDGFVYAGPMDNNVIREGKPIIQRLMIFYRATDGEYECLCPDLCGNVGQAITQLLGSNTLHALLGINDSQALDNLEITVVCLSNVHVHSNVMLTGHHFSWTTRSLSDLCVV
jgi:hypothetical protein